MTACKVSAASESGAPRLAFSYQRVSSGKQAEEGRAGIDRQADAFIGFCQRHGLTPNADPLVDRGLSAFHGSHRSRGALGTFISAAEAGRIPPGSVLVVEDLDRFSRETASHTQELLLALFRQELALGIVRDDVVVDREVHDNPSNPGIRLMLMTRGDAAHDYSRKLSGRISDVWQRRRQDWEEHRKPYLGKGSRPEWLTDDGIGFVEIPDAVEVVRRIFKLASEGNMGGTQIAELLSGEGVKPVRAAVYGPIRILRILHDRRVLGEKEWRDGSVSPGYFPRIIDQRLWEAAQNAIDARHKNKLRHGRGEVIGNLFQGISFCSCGRVLSLQRSQNRQAVKLYEVLRCSGRRTHTCPKPKGDYKYDEEALLQAFMRHRWLAFFDRPADTRKRRALEKRLRDLESLHAEQEQQASTAAINMSELLKTGELDAPTAAMLGKASSDASAAAAATQRSIQAIQAQIQQLNLQPSSADLQRQIRERVQGFIASDRHDIDERRRFNNWVMGLGVRLVVVDPKQLSIEPHQKATYDDAGGVTVAGAELVVRVP